EDLTGEIEIVLFPKIYDSTQGSWEKDNVVLISGRISARDKNGNIGEAKLMVESSKVITPEDIKDYMATGSEYKKPMPGPYKPTSLKEKLYIRLMSTEDDKLLLTLKDTIDNNRGSTEVILVLGSTTQKQAIRLPHGINKESGGLKNLE